MWSVLYPYKYSHDLSFPLLAEHSRKEQPAWAGMVVAESARGQSLSWETDIQPPSEASSHFTVGKMRPHEGRLLLSHWQGPCWEDGKAVRP